MTVANEYDPDEYKLNGEIQRITGCDYRGYYSENQPDAPFWLLFYGDKTKFSKAHFQSIDQLRSVWSKTFTAEEIKIEKTSMRDGWDVTLSGVGTITVIATLGQLNAMIRRAKKDGSVHFFDADAITAATPLPGNVVSLRPVVTAVT